MEYEGQHRPYDAIEQRGGPMWAYYEVDILPTLDEVFTAVPRSCSFHVEIKITAGPDVERTPPEEGARVVDAIWDVVYRQWGEVAPEDEAGGGGGRDLFFSSFDPGEDRSSSSCCDH